jgi:DNA-binding HxlR family transcriptional regulator
MSKLLHRQPLSRPMPYDPPVAAQTPLAAALERVGDRWSLLLIEALLQGSRRFGELSETVEGIAPNILSERLKRLEGERIVRATPYSERPPRFTYALTDEGLELAGVLRLLADWGSRGSAHAEPMRHVLCGTPVEARLWCPTCARSIDEPEADELRRL